MLYFTGASPYSMSGTPGPMMSPPPGEDSMGYGMSGMNGSGYSGVSESCVFYIILSIFKNNILISNKVFFFNFFSIPIDITLKKCFTN